MRKKQSKTPTKTPTKLMQMHFLNLIALLIIITELLTYLHDNSLITKQRFLGS